MKRRITGLIIALTIFAVAAIGLVFLSQNGNGDDAKPLSNTADQALSSSPASSPPPPIATARSPYAAFSQAKDASSALSTLATLGTARSHDVVDARLYISGICQGATTHASPEGNTWLDAELLSYCKDYADTEVMQLTSDELLVLQEGGTRAKIEDLINGDKSREQAISSLEDVVLYSDSPWEVQSALAIASERQYDLRIYRSALPANDLTNLRDVLSLTAELQYCQMVQGCGPGSAAAIRGCIFTGYCGPQVDYSAQLRQVYPPDVFADALALSRSIDSQRSPL